MQTGISEAEHDTVLHAKEVSEIKTKTSLSKCPEFNEKPLHAKKRKPANLVPEAWLLPAKLHQKSNDFSSYVAKT